MQTVRERSESSRDMIKELIFRTHLVASPLRNPLKIKKREKINCVFETLHFFELNSCWIGLFAGGGSKINE